ncbi:hypothetical protein U9M48_003532 [Paspalum notatum var. saurae]|uniref:Uncharacterized protein n=1 Tax=Paspalum notatum var. saurae TaxID=547442 RepID=A0AAQ3SE41_PASNO
MEDVWIMDSGCSRHMTGHCKWFSSLNPVSTKEYITFGDNGQGFEVRFKKGACHVLDAVETLVCSLLPFGQNGVVERKNRTLVEMARTMLDEHRTLRCFVLKKAGHMDKFESRCLDGIFLGYASSSRAFRVWILEAKQVVETCEVSFDETMPCTTPAFELSGDDEEGARIFED